jgi:hypothetical protein
MAVLDSDHLAFLLGILRGSQEKALLVIEVGLHAIQNSFEGRHFFVLFLEEPRFVYRLDPVDSHQSADCANPYNFVGVVVTEADLLHFSKVDLLTLLLLFVYSQQLIGESIA